MTLKEKGSERFESDTKREDTDRGGGNVTTEEEIRVMWPQVKERQQPPKTRRDKEWILP